MRRIAISGVLLGLAGLAPAPVAGADPISATVSAPTQRLVSGCAWYHYSYRVTPGDNDWMLQVRVIDAGGTAQAFQFFTSGSPGDPTAATPRFQLCSANVKAPGRFQLRAELDLSDGSTQTAITLPTVSFTVAPATTARSTKAKQHKKKAKKNKKKKAQAKNHRR